MNHRDSRENDYHKGTKLGKHEKTTEDTESTENKAMAVQNASENKYFHGSVPSVFSVVNFFVSFVFSWFNIFSVPSVVNSSLLSLWLK